SIERTRSQRTKMKSLLEKQPMRGDVAIDGHELLPVSCTSCRRKWSRWFLLWTGGIRSDRCLDPWVVLAVDADRRTDEYLSGADHENHLGIAHFHTAVRRGRGIFLRRS